MPVPNFMRHVNKRLFNPREVAGGKRPVLTHVGRSTGTVHRTPLEAHPVEGGYLFVIMYGSQASDWVKNVLAAGRAQVTVDGVTLELTRPRIVVGEAAWRQLPDGVSPPPRFLRVDEALRMDLADDPGSDDGPAAG